MILITVESFKERCVNLVNLPNDLFLNMIFFTFTLSSKGAVQSVEKDGILPGSGGTDMEFVRSFTQVGFPNFSILLEKTGKSRHFGQKLKMEEDLLIQFEQIGQLSTLIQPYSSCSVKTQA